jgi:hypothetical protein
MKSKKLLALLIILLNNNISFSQSKKITNDSILKDIKAYIIATDADTTKLITSIGFNVFIQKKVLNYLTDVSDLSLAKFYASYNTDNEKLNIGFNINYHNPNSKRLNFILNPIFEADLKNGFATLYKDGKANNNIRGGIKGTYLIPFSTMNFYKDVNKSRVNDFKILRTNKYKELEYNLNKETVAKTAQVNLINDSLVNPSIDTIFNHKMKFKKNESFESIGIAEANFIEKNRAFTWLQTAWISVWTLFPITEAEQYISIDNTQPFYETKFKLWEVNAQFTYLLDIKKVGTFFISPWIKYFKNNSANANLMTIVDYGKYSQFPGSNPQNFALLESNKAYLGTYNEFMTTNLNFQIVYISACQNTLIKPGFSFRFEKNWGDFSPSNLRFGLPLNIQGKEKTFNIELQYILSDINNYKSVANHKSTKTIGISLGLPFSLLYE